MPDAVHIYLRVTGISQGTFKGGISRKNRGDNWFEISSLDWSHPVTSKNLTIPKNIMITKSGDSIAFIKAQRSGELLSTVEIDITTEHANGAVFDLYRVKMTDAYIYSDSQAWDQKSAMTMETIGFNHERIDVTPYEDEDHIQGDTSNYSCGFLSGYCLH